MQFTEECKWCYEREWVFFEAAISSDERKEAEIREKRKKLKGALNKTKDKGTIGR